MTTRLRRRETSATDDALRARAALRKIEQLHAAFQAYRSHFDVVDEAMLEHLHSDESPAAAADADALPPAEQERRRRLAALKKDYVASLTYRRTGELPERVFSAGLDLPTVRPDTYAWRAHLTPAQRQRFDAAVTPQREYEFMRMANADKRAAWMARESRGVRQALLGMLREGYLELKRLHKAGSRARKAAGEESGTVPRDCRYRSTTL
jgi:hypothetical protein